MTNFSTGVARSGALELSYVAWGEATNPPVVLLHGLRAYAHWFDEVAEALLSRYHVIALDQRGRGASGWAPDGRYDTDSYVADLAALVDHLGFGRFALVGHSMGGTNAANYAALYPDRVAALVIVDSAPELASPGLTRIRSELGRTPKGFATRQEAETFLGSLHGRASARSLATRLDWMLAKDGHGSLQWRIDPAIFDPRMTPDTPERMWGALAKIVCPTLVLRGAISDLITAEIADRMAKVLPHGERAEVPGAAHMVCEDNPEGFNAAVLPFLERVWGVRSKLNG